jgi:hypothetical protein
MGPTMHLIVKSDCRIERAGYEMFATCRAEFSADPQYTTFAAKHLHPVVTLVGYRAHNGCSYRRTILRDMKPTCPTCNHRMSPATGSMFICPGCRELVQFFDVRPVDHSLPWWEKYVERPTSHQTNAWIQCQGLQKAKPPPVEPTGVSSKVDDERRALKPGGPSRTLAAS